MSDALSNQPVVSVPGLEQALGAIDSLTRWQILSTLALGEALLIVELSEKLDVDQSAMSRHMGVLSRAGMVTRNRAGQYRIPPQFLKEPGKRVADFGHFVLRLEPAAEA